MEHISLQPNILFHLGFIPVTNSILASWAAIFVILILILINKIYLKSIPGYFQSIFEMIIEFLMGLVDSVTQDKELTKKIFPWVATFFIFILFANWMELIPGFTIIGIKEIHHGETSITPLFRSANTDLNTTLALAIISICVIQFMGIFSIGFVKHIKKFINFSGPIDFFVGILELVSEISKIISFAFRLFGNIFAGEILLVVIMFLVPYFIPIPFYGLELFVGFIQALVFAMLTTVFMTMASMDMHEESH